MTDSETLIYNKTTTVTVEKYDIRELAKSFMMYKIGKYSLIEMRNHLWTQEHDPLMESG